MHMSVSRPRRRGQYAPLAARYYEDEAVMNAGPSAELLYVRGLAFCSGSMSNGFIGDAQVRAIGRDMRRLGSACASLVQWKLWNRDDNKGGYWVRSWLAWNPTTDDIYAAREADRERKKKGGSSRNPHGRRQESERSPAGIRPPDTDTHTDSNAESSDRTPPGPVRSDAPVGRALSAPDAARPPGETSWRELGERPKGKAPDFTALREQLAAAAAEYRADRPDALGELRRLADAYAPQSDSGGSE